MLRSIIICTLVLNMVYSKKDEYEIEIKKEYQGQPCSSLIKWALGRFDDELTKVKSKGYTSNAIDSGEKYSSDLTLNCYNWTYSN